MSLRQHLTDLAERGHSPQFVPADLPPLRAFAQLFDTVDWSAFEVTKWLPADGLTRTWELTAEVVRRPGDEPEAIRADWNSVAPGADPMAGFGIGTSSTFWGGGGEVPPPNDQRTQAFLLLVTTDFVHLSASREQEPPLIRGAVETSGDSYDYVVLDRSAR